MLKTALRHQYFSIPTRKLKAVADRCPHCSRFAHVLSRLI